jgi:alpha-beta hydrolase superfamily lysophospholipase
MIYNLPKPGKIKIRMLVAGARTDALVAPNKIEKTARVYKADLKIFPGMAHDLMLERGWEQVAEYMVDWLKKVGNNA